MYETGRVCLKIAGREAGKYCVIVENIDDNFVMITGPKSITRVKRRKCNMEHIEPTQEKLDIASKADDASIESLWKSSGLIEKLEIKLPVKREFKKKEEKKKKK
jgi:large subunit ribosomal protein L14e